MDLFIVTGVSTGLGSQLFEKIIKKHDCIGTTSKKNNIANNVFYHSFENITDYENDKDWIKIITKLKKYKNKNIVIFLNAAIYDKPSDNLKNKKLILNVNFFNQIIFANKINKIISPQNLKIIFFSSFEIYNNNSRMPYYKISKMLFYEEFLRLKNRDKNINYKLFIIGGIKTESYLRNTEHKKSSILKKYIIADVKKAADFIIKKIDNNSNEIIFYPKIYFFLNKIRLLKKNFIK